MSLQNYQAYPSPVSELDFSTAYMIPIPNCVHPDPSHAVVSPARILHVLGYTPTEGEDGTPISVRIHFDPELSETIYLRLVVGHKVVTTTVHEIQDTAYGRWQLDAVVPPFHENMFSSTKVLMSIQALDKNDAIIDSASFGEFSYWTPAGFSSVHSKYSATQKKPKLQVNTGFCATQDPLFRGISHLPTPSPTSPATRYLTSLPKPQVHLHRRTKAGSSIFPKNTSQNPDTSVQIPILEIITPLHTMCVGWSPAETKIGRRLVRFRKIQDGRRLIVSCEPINIDEYHTFDSVISCIYRQATDTYFVTSVDIIFLLQWLTNSDFPVEEKNRIRRNLEGLHPITISKHKHGFEGFFQHIMEFPDPKPRNIEKDLKVFEWSLIGQALEKILSKYAIDTSSIPIVEDLVPFSQSPPSSNSSSAEHRQQRYPPVKVEDCPINDLAAVTVSKFESIQDDFCFVNSSDSSDFSYSPLDGPSSAMYPISDTDLAHPLSNEVKSENWEPDYKHIHMADSENCSPYGTMSRNNPSSEADFNFYEMLALRSNTSNGVMDMADHQYL